MRIKILFFACVFVLCTCNAYGANDDDIYLRKYDMDAFMSETRWNIKELSTRIDDLEKRVNKRIDALEFSLNKRVDDTNKFFYLSVILICVITFIPKWLEGREAKKIQPEMPFTLDEIKKLKKLLETNISPTSL